MNRSSATTSGLYDAVQGLLLVNLVMESVLVELLPLLPLARREAMADNMVTIRETLDDLVQATADDTVP